MTKIRMLNEPTPIKVTVNQDGEPVTVVHRGTMRRVTRVLDQWRIDDEWWREPVSRMYFQLEYDSAPSDTIFHDLIGDKWYWQRS